MTNEVLDEFLQSLSPLESTLKSIPEGSQDLNLYRQQLQEAVEREHLEKYSRVHAPAILALEHDLRKWNTLNFKESPNIPDEAGFSMFLQPRFSSIPKHRHEYLELIYVYSGKVNQEIGGITYKLSAGDVCIMDTITSHALNRLEQHDIVMNILIRRSYFESTVLSRLTPVSPVTKFIINAAFRGMTEKGFLIVHTKDDQALREVYQRALREFLDPGSQSTVILESLLVIIFAEIARIADSDGKTESRHLSYVSHIIHYIYENCVTTDLESTSAHFNMKSRTFSSYLSSHLEKSFLDLIQEARLSRAENLLIATETSVSNIANSVGYSNVGFFYKLFKDKHGMTPASWRATEVMKKPLLPKS